VIARVSASEPRQRQAGCSRSSTRDRKLGHRAATRQRRPGPGLRPLGPLRAPGGGSRIPV